MAVKRARVLKEIFVQFEKMIKDNVRNEIKIGVLSFNTRAEWINESGLISEDDFNAKELQIRPEGMTNFSLAVEELNNKLSTAAFFHDLRVSHLPVIVLILILILSIDDNKIQ